MRRSVRHEARLGRDEGELAGLAYDMAVWLLSARADATVKKYSGYFGRFRTFAERHHRCYLPASSIDVALFITHLLNAKVSYSVVSSCVYSIKYMHNLHNFQDPTSSSRVCNHIQTSKRVGYKPVNKKDAVTSDMIKALFVKYSATTDLAVVRDLAMIIMCFCGFLRYDEVSNIKCKDITCVDKSHVDVHISKIKTDQFRDGNNVLLANVDSCCCPFSYLQLYVKLAKLELTSSDFLFKALYRTRKSIGLRTKHKKLSYTRTREVLVSRLREVAPQGFNLGLHSLRAGGASAAARANVNERCWRRHGRWKSDAAHGYVKDSIDNRLTVSKKLGL